MFIITMALFVTLWSFGHKVSLMLCYYHNAIYNLNQGTSILSTKGKSAAGLFTNQAGDTTDND